MKVGLTPAVLASVLECATHIARDDLAAAERWLDGLQRTVAQLGEFPNMGRVTAEAGIETHREVFYGRYRILYRVGDAVTVYDIRHMSRQPAALDDSNP